MDLFSCVVISFSLSLSFLLISPMETGVSGMVAHDVLQGEALYKNGVGTFSHIFSLYNTKCIF